MSKQTLFRTISRCKSELSELFDRTYSEDFSYATNILTGSRLVRTRRPKFDLPSHLCFHPSFWKTISFCGLLCYFKTRRCIPSSVRIPKDLEREKMFDSLHAVVGFFFYTNMKYSKTLTVSSSPFESEIFSCCLPFSSNAQKCIEVRLMLSKMCIIGLLRNINKTFDTILTAIDGYTLYKFFAHSAVFNIVFLASLFVTTPSMAKLLSSLRSRSRVIMITTSPLLIRYVEIRYSRS